MPTACVPGAELATLLALCGVFLDAQQPAKPAATKTVAGVCTGFDRTAGAPPVRVSLWLHDYRRESAQLVRDARAGADGAFSFADVPWLEPFDWGYAFYLLVARQGERIGVRQLRAATAADGKVEVALAPGERIAGTVRDMAGNPLAGARVHLLGMLRAVDDQPVGDFVFGAEPWPWWTTTTAADGTFALHPLPVGWTYAVEAVHERCARTRVDQPAGAAFDFQLAPAAVLTGRVLDAAGKQAVRVRVAVQGAGDHHGWATAHTGDDGTYRVLGLLPGVYNVWAEAPDLVVTAHDSIRADVGENALPDLVLIAGGFVVGRILDASTGQPVQPGPTADVAVYGPSRPRSGAAVDVAKVRPDGTYRLRVAPGDNFVYLRCGDGYEAVGQGEIVEVAAGRERVVDFTVQRRPPPDDRGR